MSENAKKTTYEAPRAIDINSMSVKGDWFPLAGCGPGSKATTTCNTGGSAQINCTSGGNPLSGKCQTGSSGQ